MTGWLRGGKRPRYFLLKGNHLNAFEYGGKKKKKIELVIYSFEGLQLSSENLVKLKSWSKFKKLGFDCISSKSNISTLTLWHNHIQNKKNWRKSQYCYFEKDVLELHQAATNKLELIERSQRSAFRSGSSSGNP